MSPGHHDNPRQAYLAEHYGPGRKVEQLTQSAGLVCAAILEMKSAGEPITYLRSTIVPKDQAFLCVIEASSEELVGQAYARAGVGVDRISAAISLEDEGRDRA